MSADIIPIHPGITPAYVNDHKQDGIGLGTFLETAGTAIKMGDRLMVSQAVDMSRMLDEQIDNKFTMLAKSLDVAADKVSQMRAFVENQEDATNAWVAQQVVELRERTGSHVAALVIVHMCGITAITALMAGLPPMQRQILIEEMDATVADLMMITNDEGNPNAD